MLRGKGALSKRFQLSMDEVAKHILELFKIIDKKCRQELAKIAPADKEAYDCRIQASHQLNNAFIARFQKEFAHFPALVAISMEKIHTIQTAQDTVAMPASQFIQSISFSENDIEKINNENNEQVEEELLLRYFHHRILKEANVANLPIVIEQKADKPVDRRF